MAASINRKTSTKVNAKGAVTAAGGASLNNQLPTYVIPDAQMRVSALETAARVVGNSTSSPTIILDAANQFYAFLTGK